MTLKCRNCKSENLTSILNLGEHFLSDFRDDLSKPPKFPLNLLLCEKCSLVQLSETVSRGLMYHDGYGYRSGTNELIQENLKWIVSLGRDFVPEPKSWLDIACNDGTLLSFVDENIEKVGVDPVAKFAAESKRHATRIISDFFSSKIVSQKFDVITSISMFYDLDDPSEFVKEVSECLNPNGVWLIQQNYLAAMLENVSFDNICHEHITYFSLTALKNLFDKHNLEIIGLDFPTINGGSILTVVGHKGSFPKSDLVDKVLADEYQQGLSNVEGYKKFETAVFANIELLSEFLDGVRERKQTVQIYGASTRGGTIWQSLGFHLDVVDAAVERQAEKIGKYYSVIGKPIISEEEMRKSPPDYLLIGPWFLRKSFLERESNYINNGGAMVFPLPHMNVVSNVE